MQLAVDFVSGRSIHDKSSLLQNPRPEDLESKSPVASGPWTAIGEIAIPLWIERQHMKATLRRNLVELMALQRSEMNILEQQLHRRNQFFLQLLVF